MTKKTKSYEEHSYNLLNGFTIAIQVAAILKAIDIVRTALLEHQTHGVDFAIFSFLVLIWILDEIITNTAFVDKKRNLDLSEKEKRKLGITITILLLILLIVLIILIPKLLVTPIV